MKRVSYGMVLPLGLLLALGTIAPAHSGMMGQRQMGQSEGAATPTPGGMSGSGMMGMMGQGGMQGMPEGMGMPRPSQLVRMLKAELGLSDEQTKGAKEIFFQVMKANIKQRADLRIAELELQELLEAEPVDMAKVEAKLKAIEGRRTTLLVTTDHGRAENFSGHGEGAKESHVWLIASGAGIGARGPIFTTAPRHLADIAATVRSLSGLGTIHPSSRPLEQLATRDLLAAHP